MKKQSTARPGRWLAATSLSLLALTFNANTATAADATWTGYGDGVNWGDMLNWENVGHTGWQTGDPRLASTAIKLNLGVDDTSTVNIDAQVAPWNGAGRTVTMSATNVLNIPTGGKLGNNDGTQMYNPAGGIINVTGGYFGMDLRPGTAPGGVCGTVNVSGGTYQASRITYVKSATVNIIGSTPTLVKTSDFFSWMNNSLPTLGFTLDAGGVTPFQFDAHGQDSYPDGNIPGPVTMNVSGIATYAAGAMPMGAVIPLVRDTNSNLFFPNSWPLGKLVDGGRGWVSRVSNGVDLTVFLPSEVSVWEGGAFDWNTAHWTVGGTANQLPGTKSMTVDVAGSVATVAADASSAVVSIGQTNTSTVTVDATKTLTAATGVVVGANGTLNVNGNLSAAAAILDSAGITSFASTSGGTIGTTNVTAGTTTLDGSATFGTVYLSGTGTLAFSSAVALNTLSVSSGTITGTATAATKFNFPLAASLTVANDLAGAAALEKAIVDKASAATTLTLSGNNTYTGVTTVSSGILSVSNLKDAGVTSNLGAYATSGPAGIVLGTVVGNHPSATLRYTGPSMTTAINRGITLAGNATVDLPITGDMRLGSLALASAATMQLNVTGSGVAASRLYIDSVVVPTTTTCGLGPVFNPTTASLTIGTITGDGGWTIRGNGDHIVTGPINMGPGFTGYGTQRDYGQIAGFSTGGSWTFLSDNTFAGRFTYGGGATLIFKSPGTVISGQNVSYAFGKSTTQDWIATDSDTTYKTFWGNSTIHLLNDLSTSYETGFAPGRKTPVHIAGSATTILVGPQTSATNQTHSLGDMWMRENHNLTVNGSAGFGLSLDTVRLEDTRTQAIIANTSLTIAKLRKIGTGTNNLTIRGTGTTTVTGVVEKVGGTLNITKSEAGTMILNGGGSFNTMNVTAGKLFVNGATNLTTTSFDVSNATLGGTGTIDCNVTIQSSGKLAFNLITPAGTHDSLELTSGKTFNTSASELDITGNDVLAAPGGAYTLVYAPGGITGSVPTTVNLPAGWTFGSLLLTESNTKLVLTVTIPGGDPYATWAGAGVNAFDADANNDGVDNGMAWVLGALNKDANATSLLPTLDNTDPTYFIFTYNRKDDANTDTNTTIKAEYCSDLATWTEAVHDGSNIIINPSDDSAGVGIDSVQVKIKRTLAVGGKLFARLNVQKAP